MNSDQPAPTPGKQVVLETVMELLEGDQWEDLKDDILVRGAIGLERYGTFLMSYNGRNYAIDLYQEIIDAIMYSTQGYMEEQDDFMKQILLDSIHVLAEQAYGIRQYLDSKGIIFNG